MKNKENLNRYLSNLGILITKTHNLHWNVVGARFKAIHEYTESLYDYYFEKFDDKTGIGKGYIRYKKRFDSHISRKEKDYILKRVKQMCTKAGIKICIV